MGWINYLIGAAIVIPAVIIIIRGIINFKRGKTSCCKSSGCSSCPGCSADAPRSPSEKTS